jgi:hypothetical protein
MLWGVEGGDRETGADRAVIIEAESQDEAIRIAGEMGLVAATAREILTPLEGLREQLLPAGRGSRPGASAPSYRGLRVAGVLYRLLGVAFYASSVVASIAAVTLLVMEMVSTSGKGNYVSAGQAALVAVAAGLTGVFYHGFGSAFLALRDLTINSFGRR